MGSVEICTHGGPYGEFVSLCADSGGISAQAVLEIAMGCCQQVHVGRGGKYEVDSGCAFAS